MNKPSSSQRMLTFACWSARIWAGVMVLLTILVAITPAPAGSPAVSWLEQIGLAGYGLSALGLLVAWRWQIIGGIIALFGVLAHDVALYIAKGFQPEWVGGNLLVGILYLLPAALLLFCRVIRRRQNSQAQQ